MTAETAVKRGGSARAVCRPGRGTMGPALGQRCVAWLRVRHLCLLNIASWQPMGLAAGHLNSVPRLAGREVKAAGLH